MSDIDGILTRVAKTIPSGVTPSTRIEIHPSDWLSVTDEIERLHLSATASDEALRELVENEGAEHYRYLDKGIGSSTPSGQRWLNARAIIAKGETAQEFVSAGGHLRGAACD